MNTVELANIVRVFTLLTGAVSFVLSLMALQYFQRRNPPAALRSHVLRVTLTYLAFVAYGTAETVTHWSHHFRWQLLATIVVFTFAVNAQAPLVAYERKTAKFEGNGRRLSDTPS